MQPAVKGNCLLIALGHPIGASSIPVGKGISKGNSVLLCLGCSEGIEFPFDWKNPKKPAVSWHTTFLRKVQCVIPLWSRWQPELQHTLESVATVAAFWQERLPLAGQHKRQKKAGRRCGYALSASLVICGTKVYQSPPSAAAYYRIRTTTAVSRVGCPSLLPPPSLSGSR